MMTEIATRFFFKPKSNKLSTNMALCVMMTLLLTCMTGLQSTTAFTATKHRGTNRLFLDTAVESEWKELIPTGIFHGITTNPTLLERANHKCTIPAIHELASRALNLVGCDEFMCQAWGASPEDMYQVGMELSSIDRARIVIKVPVTMEGTKAARMLIESGVRVCLTACYASHQAIIAAGLGAEYLAPYLGRMNDNGKDGMAEIRRMQDIANGMGSSTRIFAASIRDATSMGDLICYGMDSFTFSPEVARELFSEDLTDKAACDFEEAAKRGGEVSK